MLYVRNLALLGRIIHLALLALLAASLVAASGRAWAQQAIAIGGAVPTTATYKQVAIVVPAGTQSSPTVLSVAGAAQRALFIQPPQNGTLNGCTVDLTGAAGGATASSTPLGNGWVFDSSTPPPNATVTAWCPNATTLSVTQGN